MVKPVQPGCLAETAYSTLDKSHLDEALKNQSLSDAASCARPWYLQAEDGVLLGPFSLPEVTKHFANDVVDGMSFCWKQGMADWRRVADVEELRAILIQHTAEDATSYLVENILESQDPTADTQATPFPHGSRAADSANVQSQAGAIDEVVAQFIEETLNLPSEAPEPQTTTRFCAAAPNVAIEKEDTRESKKTPASDDQTDVAFNRCPLEDVPEKLKYITPEGLGQVYDTFTKKWMTFADYRSLTQPTAAKKTAPVTSDTGENHTTSSDVQDDETKRLNNLEKRRRYRDRLRERKKQGAWIKGKSNPNVYVTNLPPDVTEEELEGVFKKAGVLKINPDTSKPKIRIYQTAQGQGNGDALIGYVNPTSVDLAIKYLDNYPFRNGDCIIHVERAQFNTAGLTKEAEPGDTKKSSSVVAAVGREEQRKRYLAAKMEQKRLLSWNEGLSDGRIRVMILRPLWHFEEAVAHPASDVSFYKRIAESVKESLSVWTTVVSVTPIPRHPNGIVCVKFRSVPDCEAAVARLNGQEFRQLGLPEREVEILVYRYMEWRRQNPGLALPPGSCLSPASPTTQPITLDDYLIDLLPRLETKVLEREKRDLVFQSDAKLGNKRQCQDIKPSSHSTITPFVEEQSSSSNFIDGDEELPDTPEIHRAYLPLFLGSSSLCIQAYVYDGVTDLKGQSLPESYQRPAERRERKMRETSLSFNVTETGLSKPVTRVEETEDVTSTQSEQAVNHSTERDAEWQAWLEDEGDDDSDDETFVIHTEEP